MRHPVDGFAIPDFGNADVGVAQAPRGLMRHPVDGFAIPDFGNADVGFARAPRGLVIRDPLRSSRSRISP
ncbi:MULTISPECIES: hypothetical protein [unclassified Methylobacterium]|uniref:hypothetical protein n=1 Tax=unclassified Methylobacterium TaxID=2615210 RepID=UPI0003241DFC|nr:MULTISPECIES: hypothetical protein [Methylobacterium]WFT78611.1 hypothetical protein QA634_25575 [Methylobacterium nodulans]